MMGYVAAFLAVVALVGTVGGFYTGRDYGMAEHEALANATALANAKKTIELKDQDLETERTLRVEAQGKVDDITAEAEADKSIIRQAHAQAVQERDAARAEAAEARQAAGEQSCPELSELPEYCPWDWLLPPLER